MCIRDRAYPELNAQKTLIEKGIKEEEESFLRTLETGIRLLDKTMNDAKAAGKKEISGVDAFTSVSYTHLDVYKRQLYGSSVPYPLYHRNALQRGCTQIH